MGHGKLLRTSFHSRLDYHTRRHTTHSIVCEKIKIFNSLKSPPVFILLGRRRGHRFVLLLSETEKGFALNQIGIVGFSTGSLPARTSMRNLIADS